MTKLRWVLRIPIVASSDIGRMLIVYMPGSLGVMLRRLFYRRKFSRMGRNVSIGVGVIINGCSRISIGDDVEIGPYSIIETGTPVGKLYPKENTAFAGKNGGILIGSNVHICQFCIIMGYGGVEIGNKCTLSAGTKIYSLTNTSHDPADPEQICSIMPYSTAPFLIGPVVLKCNVWLGLGAIVMPGVTIERDSFATANAVITRSCKENSYLSGQPARVIRHRFAATDGQARRK